MRIYPGVDLDRPLKRSAGAVALLRGDLDTVGLPNHGVGTVRDVVGVGLGLSSPLSNQPCAIIPPNADHLKHNQENAILPRKNASSASSGHEKTPVALAFSRHCDR